MKYMQKILLKAMIASFILSYTLSATATNAGGSRVVLEVLHGVSVEPDTLSIDVLSTGCTSNDDFKFDIRKRKSGIELAVIRVNPDPCDAISHTVTLTFKRSAIGLESVDTFAVRNKFRGFPRFSF